MAYYTTSVHLVSKFGHSLRRWLSRKVWQHQFLKGFFISMYIYLLPNICHWEIFLFCLYFKTERYLKVCMKISEHNFTLKISKSLSQKHLGAIRKTIKSRNLQGNDAVDSSLTVIFLESDTIRKLHGLRLYNLP